MIRTLLTVAATALLLAGGGAHAQQQAASQPDFAKAEIKAAFSGSMMKFWNNFALSGFFASLRTATLSMKSG